ncbi:MAG: hypothetical protein ACOC9T_00555 [Myxococcota bacterium]
MSLRDEAAADLRAILEDTEGLAVAVTVTSPEGTQAELSGLVADIGQTTDPETGQLVVGRQASVALPVPGLSAAGLGTPRLVPEGSKRPWLVRWTGQDGVERTFKVVQVLPDELGVVTCILEAYGTS